MKRFISLLIIIFALPFLAGCNTIYSNYREIQQLLVVQTLGLDREKGGVLVSLAAAAKVTDSGPKQMSAHGGTITAAMDRAYKMSYEEEIFFSHVNSLLIGETAAEEGIEPFLDYVCQSPSLRVDIPLYIVREGTANQAVMEVGDGKKGISEVMRSVRESFASPSGSHVFTVADTLSSLERYGSAIVCAVQCVPSSETVSSEGAGKQESQSGQSQSGQQPSGQEQTGQQSGQQQAAPENAGGHPLMAAPAGYAIIRDGKLCKFLEPEDAVAVGLLMDSVPVTSIEVRDDKGQPTTLEIDSGSAEIRPIWSGKGQLKGLDIQARVSASLLETGGAEDIGGEEYINHLTGELEAAVSQRLSALLQTSMKLKADFLHLATRVERSSPEDYRLMEQSFPELLPGLELQLTVSGQLSHTNDMKEA